MEINGTLLVDGSLQINNPVLDNEAVSKVYADQKLARTGGTMTGDLILAHDPVANLEAATKQFVVNLVAGSAPVPEMFIVVPAIMNSSSTTNATATLNLSQGHSFYITNASLTGSSAGDNVNLLLSFTNITSNVSKVKIYIDNCSVGPPPAPPTPKFVNITDNIATSTLNILNFAMTGLNYHAILECYPRIEENTNVYSLINEYNMATISQVLIKQSSGVTLTNDNPNGSVIYLNSGLVMQTAKVANGISSVFDATGSLIISISLFQPFTSELLSILVTPIQLSSGFGYGLMARLHPLSVNNTQLYDVIITSSNPSASNGTTVGVSYIAIGR